MARRTIATAAAVLLACIGTHLVLAPAVSAAAPATEVRDDGWWWRLQSGVGPEVPPPPNVGDEQLLVQSSVDGAQAIAAVDAVLADGQVDPTLTLDVADDQGGANAVLLACQVGSAWTGVHAGRWDAKPLVDCETGSVAGVRAEDGSQWSFDLTTLQFNDKINVVLVPGLNEDDSAPNFSLVFEPPTAASITTVAAPAPSSTTTSPTTNPTTTTRVTSPPSNNSGGGSFTPPPTSAAPAPSPSPTVPPVTAAELPAIEPEDQGQSAVAPIVQETAFPPPPEAVEEVVESRAFARVVGVLILLVAAGLGYLAVRRNDLVGTTASTETPVLGGLARFRQERTAEPVNINA